MKEYTYKIEFPVMDISNQEWNKENISEIIFNDIYFHNNSYELFKKFRLNHKVVDCKGNIYRIVNIEINIKSWKNFFFKPKQKMAFELLVESITLEDLKNFVLKRVNSFDENEYKSKWIENIKNSRSFKELIIGK